MAGESSPESEMSSVAVDEQEDDVGEGGGCSDGECVIWGSTIGGGTASDIVGV